MKKICLIVFSGLVTTMSCDTPVTKKILILGRGKITAQENNITMSGIAGSTEETVEVKGEKAVSWNVTTPAGKTTVNIPEEKGLYILNLKTDTIVGSQQNMGKDLAGRTITQEELKGKIDSLVKLTGGTNISPGNHNYFILPNQLAKVSSNMEAKIFGPFTKIPSSLETDKSGNAPEIYKFYTNTEMRQLITNLRKNTF